MRTIKKQRSRLWHIDPHCKNCGVLTILPEHLPDECFKNEKRSKLKIVPKNMATIQHSYSKLHPLRHAGEHNTHALWCWKCNQEYNDKYENHLNNGRQ